MANGSPLRITVGATDWSAGVNSNKTPTQQSAQNPNGLPLNSLAWGNNITVRQGCISPRFGWQDLASFTVGIGIHQESYLYAPRFSFPYIVSQIAGRTFLVRVDLDPVVIQEVTIAGDPNPPNIEQAWMTQGEEFLIIQDGVSEPLVWDGNVLRRISAMGGTPPYLRTAESMVYYQGRIWEALGREYWAGDIVGNPAALGSGTAAYGGRDAILHMVENTFTSLGGSFTVPTTAGNIRALNYPANINTFLGQGPLLIFTRQQIYAADIPISRTDWVAANNNTGILVKIMQINFGTTSDRSVVHVNGDVFYQSVDGVRSLFTAVRNFGEWGDLPISVEEARAIQLNDRALLRFGSGITFDNRLLQTCLPFQTDVGVCHKGILPLNFDLLSTLGTKLPPAWEGIQEGLDILRLVRGDFGGRERAFALVRSRLSGGIECWELTSFLQEDDNDFGDARITWSWESPSFTFGDPFSLKRLDCCEIWLDRMYGPVEFHLQYRPDQHSCWEPMYAWTDCAPRNNCEDCGVLLPDACYPSTIYREQYRATVVTPKPPSRCEASQHRPIDLGYSFQFRMFVKGFCRIRGFMVHAYPVMKSPYESVTQSCAPSGCGP